MAYTPVIAPSLERLRKASHNDFQRPSRFAVRFDSLDDSWFSAAAKPALNAMREGLLCSNITTPAREFETTELSIFGYDETYPTGTEFTAITCTFLLPLMFAGVGVYNSVLTAFTDWQSRIQNVRTGGVRTFRFPDAYRLRNGFVVETRSNYETRANTLTSGAYNDPGTGVYTPIDLPSLAEQYHTEHTTFNTNATRYYNVYPKTVQPSDLDWSATDEFLQLRVEFSFTHWEDVTGQ